MWLVSLPMWMAAFCSDGGSQASREAMLVAGPSAESSFEVSVMPILAKRGCNSASCHGATAGQGGFRLSLFSGDPDLDYDQIVRDRRGRRVHRTSPAESLLLLKATESLDHGGGARFDEESEAYRVLRDWIASGAPRGTAIQVVGLDVRTSQPPPFAVGDRLPLVVTATLRSVDSAQMWTHEVSHWSVLESYDESVATVVDGAVHLLRPGRAHVLVRYLQHTHLAGWDVPWGSPQVATHSPSRHWIDEHLDRGMAAMGLEPAPTASPSILIRRLYLDLTGRLPTAARVQSLLATWSDESYAELVDELLNSPAFDDQWTFHLANWLRVDERSGQSGEAAAYQGWLRDQVARDRPWSDVLRECLTALGPIEQNGAVGFYRMTSDPRIQAERASEIWMGVRLRCAQCHHHPLDRWTMADYHGLAAVFSKIDYNNPLRHFASGGLIDGERGGEIAPRLPGTDRAVYGDDPREALADWLLADDVPFFGRAMVNRIWHALMGRGFYEPLDDWRETNPVTHPELLRELVDFFRKENLRLRPLVRAIVLSAAYQRTSLGAHPAGRAWYQSFTPRRLPAALIVDAWRDVGLAEPGGATVDEESVSRSGRAIQMPLPHRDLALAKLGACDRQVECGGGPSSGELELAALLHWLNGLAVNQYLSDESGWLSDQFRLGRSDGELVEAIYWRALVRAPRPEERAFWLAEAQRAADETARKAVWQDALWSILSCDEFTMVW